MPEAIRQYCSRTGQTVPQTEGAILRCALESIAMKFRYTLEMCESLTGTKIDTLHIVGGGTKNRQLCQAAADACGRRVVAGPIEATAIGNLMMQAVASGDVSGIPQAREIIRDSFEVIEYLPHDTAAWQDAYARFCKVTGMA
jgi:sugar (pentulose or hexulose) kinase